MKKIICIISIFCCFCLTACSSKNEKEMEEVINYLLEISEYELKIEKADITKKGGGLEIDIMYRNIHTRYKNISKIYDQSDQKELILSAIKDYISKEWFTNYLKYIYEYNDYFNPSDISQNILEVYE